MPEDKLGYSLPNTARGCHGQVLRKCHLLHRYFLRVLSRMFHWGKWLCSLTLSMPTCAFSRMGFAGDVLLVPVSLLWMGWPLYVAWTHTGVWVPLALFTLYLVVWGRDIIAKSWNAPFARVLRP